MDYLLAVIIGVLSSFVASLIFLLFLTRIRPNILISDKIAKNDGSITSGDYYRIKVINKTPRSIINVKAELKLVSLIAIPGGVMEMYKTIPLKASVKSILKCRIKPR